MPINASLYAMKKGDAVRADDWNTGFREIDRLDADQADKAQDTLGGTLTVRGMTVVEPMADLTVRALSVTGTATLPVGAVGDDLLGLTVTKRSYSAPAGAHVFLILEEYTIGDPPAFPAFARFTTASVPIRLTLREALGTLFGTPQSTVRRALDLTALDAAGNPVTAGVAFDVAVTVYAARPHPTFPLFLSR